jgi:CHAD domain-containing protein
VPVAPMSTTIEQEMRGGDPEWVRKAVRPSRPDLTKGRSRRCTTSPTPRSSSALLMCPGRLHHASYGITEVAAGAESIADRFAVAGVVPATPLCKAAPLLLMAKAAPLFELADAAASGTDADAVHDMRVASRRTREAMTLLEQYYGPKAYARHNDRIRAVTKALGRVRDADVFAEEFASLAARAKDPEERVALAWLVGLAGGRRPSLVRRMRKRLAELDMGRCGGRFERFAADVREVPGAREPIGGCATDAISSRVTAVYEHLPAALDPANALALHAMRIDAKRLRYAVETFAPAFDPERLDALYPVLKGLQDELGELHDRDVFTDAVHAAEAEGSARAAGVTDDGLEAVIADLASERARRFTAFRRLVDVWPESRMRGELLDAIVKLPPVEGIPGS